MPPDHVAEHGGQLVPEDVVLDRKLPPISSADGNRNMFTTECSKAMPKNSVMGIHMASTLPPTVVDTMAPTTPVDTIQLQSTPRTKSVSMPAAPCDL